MSSNMKNAVLWLVLIAVAALIWIVVRGGQSNLDQPSFAQLIQYIEEGKVRSINIKGTDVTGHYTDGRQFRTNIPTNYPAIYDLLRTKNVQVTVRTDSGTNWVSVLA